MNISAKCVPFEHRKRDNIGWHDIAFFTFASQEVGQAKIMLKKDSFEHEMPKYQGLI